jgi:lysophospholipase L1-like esterase
VTRWLTELAFVNTAASSIRRMAVVVVVVLATVGVSVHSTDRSASAATTKASRTTTISRAGADSTSRLIKIMPLGDSITQGGGSPGFNGYRVDLAKRLAATGLRVDFVGSQRNGAGPDTDHEGHSHWTIQDIAAHVDAWLATYEPDVILLNVGTNNTGYTTDLAWAPGALSALIDQLKADRPTADIFVSKITSSKSPARQTIIDTFNAIVPEIVADKGPKVHLVDQSTVGGRDLRDNIHPNDFGYAKMSYNWYNALESVLGPEAARWPAGDNPYAATKAYLCVAINPAVYASASDCRWWYLRTQARVWQTVRTGTQSYRAVVRGYYRTTVVAGKAVRTRVPTHWATRYRQVPVWADN